MHYYVDPQNGSNSHDGKSEATPLRDIHGRRFAPGDTVLFKRGTVIRQALLLCDGTEEGYITYSAYGRGPDPVVNPSTDASVPSCWEEVQPGLWQFTGTLAGEMCNIVLNDGERFGHLRWSVEALKNEGEWTYTLLGHSMHEGQWERWGNGKLFLVCPQNPAAQYRRIELVTWGDRRAVSATHYVKIEHFTFEKSGVHGFAADQADHIEIRHCTFRCIGGGVFDLPTRVRLGNGVEFWNGAFDCVVEHCVFTDIYDSGITHQGMLPESFIPERLYFRHNLFLRCGMAAYEWRGPSSRDIYFENNLCLQAGGAFTLQGNPPPRETEIPFSPATCVYVLIWLLEQEIPPDDTFCTIRGNLFCHAPPYGAALSAGVEDRLLRQFKIDGNVYLQEDPAAPVIRTETGLYSGQEFKRCQAETGLEPNGRFLSSL